MKTTISLAAMSRTTQLERSGRYDGQCLLKDLCGENGEHMQAVAWGYLMASCERHSMPSAANDEPVTLEQQAGRVALWLELNPEHASRPAHELIRDALAVGSSGADREIPQKRADWLPRCGARLAVAARRPGLGIAAAVSVIALAAALAVTGVHREHAAGRAAELGYEASEIRNLVLEERRYEKDSFLNIDDRPQLGVYAGKWIDSRRALSQAIDRLAALDLRDEDRSELQSIDADFRIYAQGYEAVLAMIRSGQIRSASDANEQLARYKEAAHRVEAACATLARRAMRRAADLT